MLFCIHTSESIKLKKQKKTERYIFVLIMNQFKVATNIATGYFIQVWISSIILQSCCTWRHVRYPVNVKSSDTEGERERERNKRGNVIIFHSLLTHWRVFFFFGCCCVFPVCCSLSLSSDDDDDDDDDEIDGCFLLWAEQLAASALPLSMCASMCIAAVSLDTPDWAGWRRRVRERRRIRLDSVTAVSTSRALIFLSLSSISCIMFSVCVSIAPW